MKKKTFLVLRLMIISDLYFLYFFGKINKIGSVRKMKKDRKDGRYIKPVDSVHAIFPYLLDKRTDSEVCLKANFDVTELKKYIDEKNKKLEDGKITLFHAFVTATAKTIYNRPLLNNFVAAKRYYSRNEIIISFVAKDKMSDSGEERLIMLKVKDDMNLESISSKIFKDVKKTRKLGTNDIDDSLKFITKFPRGITNLIVKGFKWLDYHGWVPRDMCDGDPNYSTVMLSNLGSIKSGSCYHHLNNYGTNSIVGTIGVIHPEYTIDKDGKVIEKQIVDISFTLDERIADGFYFAKSVKLLEYIISNPKLLDEIVSKEIKHDC